MARRSTPGDGVGASSERAGTAISSKGGDGDEGNTSSKGTGLSAPPAPSPRLSAAGKRLAEEKSWLVDLPQHCIAEPTRASDFVWSFRVSGLHGTLYQVCLHHVFCVCSAMVQSTVHTASVIVLKSTALLWNILVTRGYYVGIHEARSLRGGGPAVSERLCNT